MRKYSLIIIFLLVLVVTLSIVKAVLYNKLSTSGVLVGKLEEEINYYKTQNVILEEKLLSLSSLANISLKAIGLSFVQQDSSLVLKPLPLAIKQ